MPRVAAVYSGATAITISRVYASIKSALIAVTKGLAANNADIDGIIETKHLGFKKYVPLLRD